LFWRSKSFYFGAAQANKYCELPPSTLQYNFVAGIASILNWQPCCRTSDLGQATFDMTLRKKITGGYWLHAVPIIPIREIDEKPRRLAASIDLYSA